MYTKVVRVLEGRKDFSPLRPIQFMSGSVLKKFPPLHALTAFEAVARQQSFARAAEELCVTHGAVSHRIKLLETYYGTRLLLRRGGAVTLTTKGTYLLTSVVYAMSALQEASERVSHVHPVVSISAGPSSARNWLILRLGGFYRDNPDIDLEITANKLSKEKKRAAVESGEADIGLRYGCQEEWVGLKCVKLMDVELFPVSSPAYLKAVGGLSVITDLRKVTFLRLPHEPWKPWFQAAGLDFPEPVTGPLFGDASLMLDAAANGQGVALARSVLVERDISSGRFVRLFDVSLPSPRGYYAVCSAAAEARPEVQRFLEWLVASSRQLVKSQASLDVVHRSLSKGHKKVT